MGGSLGDIATSLGRYELLSRLGVGGMAEVFLARFQGIEGFEKRVVVKRLLPQHAARAELVRMFLDEARLAARLRHPCIAQVHDVGAGEGTFHFAMEYVDGHTLLSLRRAGERMPLAVALTIVVGACAGLHYAHELTDESGRTLEIVHRDVSPTNLMVTYDGYLKIVDFGIAKAATATAITRDGVIKGTRCYMSPEQCRGERVDRRSDVFALGIVLWELTTGTMLYDGDNEFAVLRRIVSEPPRPPSSVVPDYPAELERIALRALASRPEERYPTAQALQLELEAFARAQGLNLSPIAVAEHVHAVAPRRGGVDASELPSVRSDEPPTPETEPLIRDAEGAQASDPAPRARARRLVVPLVVSAIAIALTAVVAKGLSGQRARTTARSTAVLEEAWTRAHQGEYERASELLNRHLIQHPEDPDALTLSVLTYWWSSDRGFPALAERTLASPLRPPQRALVQALWLLDQGRATEATEYLIRADREDPGEPEILYAMGEAMWHAARTADAVPYLERAFRINHRWQVGLHHVIDYHLAFNRPEIVRGLAAELARHDETAGAVANARASMLERDYEGASRGLRLAIARDPRSAGLHAGLAEALTMAGQIDEAELAARLAFETWPIDRRETEGLAHLAELRLYRGDLAGYLKTVPEASRTRQLVETSWLKNPPRPPQLPEFRTPLTAAIHLVVLSAAGEDPTELAQRDRQPDIVALGEGLAAERRGDARSAAAAYQRGVAGAIDTRMLLAYLEARALRAAGDPAAAATACEEVLFPRLYLTYRAVLLPDCVLWTSETAGREQAEALLRPLVAGWSGSFDHPAVAAARRRLLANDPR